MLVKAFSLIELLASAGGNATLAELAAATAQAKPTTHRILRSLLAMGYVRQADGRAYCLTNKLSQLALGSADRDLVDCAQPILQRLRDQTGETVNLGVVRQQNVVYLTVIESNHALRRVGAASGGDPMFTTALGRAIVSQLPPPAMERLLRSVPIPQRTAHTVTDACKLRQILVQAKRDGHVIERDQTDLGVTCLGAPVFRGGGVVAAISISAPTARAQGRETEWLNVLRVAAHSLGRKLDKGERAIA